MSYSNNIPSSDIGNYQRIQDWHLYYSTKISEVKKLPQLPGLTLHIKDKIFTSSVYFNGIYQYGLKFENCYFLDNVQFIDSEFKGDFAFTRCFFDEEMGIYNELVKFNAKCDFIELSLKSQLVIAAGIFNDCNWSCIDNATLKISGGVFKNLQIRIGGNSYFKYLSFDFRKLKGSIRVNGGNYFIEEISLFQYSPDVSISIEDLTINCLSIYRFRIDKSFRLSNIKSEKIDNQPSEFSIIESFLGGTELYSIDLNSFSEVNILDSHIVDCSFVNINWKYNMRSFKGRGIYKSDEEKSLEEKIRSVENKGYVLSMKQGPLHADSSAVKYFQKNREVFRQLKFALSKQGDLINEQKFHSQEMLAYYQTISLRDSPGTKTIIWFSHAFSDFGQNIWRPLLGLFGGQFVFFFTLLFLGHFTDLSISCNPNYEGFKKGIEYYFKLISPIRKDADDFHGFFAIIDIVMRVWVSYMIYNIIRASRRFIK